MGIRQPGNGRNVYLSPNEGPEYPRCRFPGKKQGQTERLVCSGCWRRSVCPPDSRWMRVAASISAPPTGLRRGLALQVDLGGVVVDHLAGVQRLAGAGGRLCKIFADLNLPHADDLLAKAELAAKIIAEIQRRRLTQSQAATTLGIDRPKISALKQGKLSGFSLERLMRLLLRLGRDVEITVKGRSKPGSAARLRVA